MSWTDTIDDILEPLLRTDDRLRQGLEGCSADDIARIEAQHGHPLPGAFVALLGRIGRSRGALMPGADFAFPDLLEYREVAESLLGEQDDLTLDERDFVFWMEQGYQFFFFRTDGSDDPAVRFYNDDDPEFVDVADSLTSWLRSCVEDEIELRS
jgi:hypothetical protein